MSGRLLKPPLREEIGHGGVDLSEYAVLLEGGTIAVVRSQDPKAKEYVDPKTRAGRRAVPVPRVLARELAAARLRAGRASGLVFGRSDRRPFTTSTIPRRAQAAWKAAGLAPITLHAASHTYASVMIAAGVNGKALSTYMGHASIGITFDRYGHRIPGNEAEAAELLDALLERRIGA